MEYITLIGTVALVHFLALLSPGPDFIMACRNAITYSRRIGIWTAVGFGLGIAVHVTYSLAGLAIVIAQSILLFNAIKYLGAAYLIYIGIKSLRSKSSNIVITKDVERDSISKVQAVKIGFLTNVLNPKATLFILSLFTFVIDPNTPFSVMMIVGMLLVITTIVWFSLVSIFFSQKRIRCVFQRFQNGINKTLGGILIALGIKVALTEK